MGVRIEFYGLCLFVWEADRVRVLLPNATRLDRTHPDGSNPERVHYPYFINRDDTGAQFVLPMDGQRITPSTPAQKPARDALGDLINLGVLKAGMKLRADANAGTPALIAAEIMLLGGRIAVSKRAPTGNYEFLPGSAHRLTQPACRIVWEGEDDRIDFTIQTPSDQSAKTRTVRVDAKDGENRRVVIGNVCDPDVLHWDCEAVFCPPGTTVRDDDFKWLYHPFEWTSPTELPIPTVACGSIGGLSGGAVGFAAMGASVSTCFPGEWCPPLGPCP
jgi:hypothetical protein